MHLEHLTHVHPRGHAQRVQADVARRAVGHVRHVLDRNDLRHHALVAVAAGHLVAGLQAALDGQVDLDHLEHARGQLVALRELLALFFEREVEAVARLLERVLDRLQLRGHFLVGRADVEPVELLDRRQVGLVELGALGELVRAAVGDLAGQQLLDPVEGIGLDDAKLVVQVEAEALELVVDDLLGALVALDAFAGEHLHVDHGALRALVHAQRGVLHVRSLLAEDGAQQLLFRRQRGLALRRDLAHQRVAGHDFGTHVDDAGLVEAVELLFGQVRDVARDFLGAELGVAGHHHQFLDVDRGVAVVGHDAFGDQDRVFEVVAVPGHERDQHVLAQGQFAEVGRCTVGHHVALGDLVAALDDRTLVDVGVLVRTLILDQVVDVHADFAGRGLVVVHAHHDTGRVDVVDDTAAGGRDHGAGVDRGDALDAGADHRLLGAQHGHGLTLHVGAHQRAVRVVVLEERNQRGGHRHDLCGRHVHVLDALGTDQDRFAGFTRRDQVAGQHAVLVQGRVGLGDDVLAFLDGRQVVDLVRDLAVDHAAIRRLDEAVFVQAGIQGQRVDQADVRAFGRFDRADAAVMGHVHVAHFEAGTLARQTARAKGRHAALVGDLGQRVRLVHELRQLRGAEELLQRGRDRLAVDQVVRHQRLLLRLTQTFLHGLLDTGQAGAVLVLGQFADATHAAVAEVVDVVDFAVAVAQVHQDLDDRQDVLVGQHHRAGRLVAADLGVELHAADARQVVRVRVVEQALEQGLHRVFRRRLAGAHHAVDRHARGELVHRFVDAQGLRDVRALVEFVGVDDLDVLHAGAAQLLQQRFGQLVVGLGQDFARIGIDDVACDHAADQEVFRHADVRGAALLEFARVARGDPLVLGDHDLARLVGDVEARDFAAQALGDELHLRAAVHEAEVVVDEEVREDRFRVQADGLQQDRDRHLAATVDAEVQHVLRVELEVEPRTAVGNHAGREQQLARAVRLALVVFEEHARRTVQLRNDHAFRAVDDERALLGHERHFAHVDLLLLHFLDHLRLRGRRLAVIDDELDLGAHRRGEGQTTGLALAHVERRLRQVVLEELHLDETVVRDDREGGVERGLQAFDGAFLRSDARLQERRVGVLLHLQQVGNFDDAVAAAETFSDALAFGVTVRGRLGHESSGA